MSIINEFYNYLEENYEVDGEKNTIKSYVSDIKQFINFFKEYYGEDIIDFSKAHLIEYKKYLLEDKSLKFSSINRKISSISIYENFLIKNKIRTNQNKIIKKNDFYKIDMPLITSDMIPRKTIQKLRLKAGERSKRDYAIFVLLDEAGLRVSELVNLQLKRDIDFEMHFIHILGKGRKIRQVFMNNIIYEAIMDYLPEREKMIKGKENKYLFVSCKTANTNQPMNRISINNLLSKYCTEINVNKIHPHIFRHNCATKWYEEGCSDLILKKLLGHSSNATDIYTHTGNEKFINTKLV